MFGLVLYFGSGFIKGIISKFFVNAVPAKNSVLEETLETDFIVIRQEEVVSAPCSGSLETACREGERIAKGTVVGYLVTVEGTSLEKKNRVPVASPRAGILSFQTDGYENICSPKIWPHLNISKLALEQGLEKKDNGNPKTYSEAKEKTVEAGQNHFRIIDNLEPNHLYMENKELLPEVLSKGTVDLRLKNIDNLLIRGTVVETSRDSDIHRVLIEVPSLAELQNTRIVEGSIILKKYHGFVVDRQVLVTRDGSTGLYLLKKGQVAWQEVRVIGTGGAKAAVVGLETGDWIVTAPRLVKEGQRIFFFNKTN